LAMAGVALRLLHHGAGLKRARLAHAHHHLHALPDAHLGHLAHQVADLLELPEKLLDIVRFDAAAGGDATAAADVDEVGIGPLRLGHGVDHALDAADGV